jgi:hypothetical protein
LEGEWFHPFFAFPLLHLVLYNYVLDRLVGGFSHLFSFPWLILFCGCIEFVTKCVCVISVFGGCNFLFANSK